MSSSALKKVLENAAKKHELRVGSMSEVAEDVEAITTGNISIDYITGVGGFAKGRIYELFGAPSSGKTTLALQAAVSAQRAGMTVLYMDFEQAMDMSYARALGLDVDNPELFLFAQPDSLEQGSQVARELIETGEVGIAIFDSVAAMTPEAILTAEAGKATIALQARLMSEELQKFVKVCKKTKCTAVFLNHVSTVIDTSYIGKQMAARGVTRETTPGGKALKFYASVRIQFKPSSSVKDEVENALTGEKEKVATGNDVNVVVIKNKVAPPFLSAKVRVQYGKGFSNAFSVMQILVAHKVIRKSAGNFFLPPELVTASGVISYRASDKAPYIKGEDELVLYLERPNVLEAALPLVQQVLAKKERTPLVADQPAEVDLTAGEDDVLAELEDSSDDDFDLEAFSAAD